MSIASLQHNRQQAPFSLTVLHPALVGVFICALFLSIQLKAQSLIDKSGEYEITAGETSASFGSGANFLDVNGDGLDDITIVNPNDSLRLFLSIGEGFIKAPSPIYCPAGTQQVLWADYDNDGDLDLYVVVQNGVNRLFENDGNFMFEDVTLGSGLSMIPAMNFGASLGDYDNDGYLDIYVARYYLPNNPNGQTNKLYRNNGDGTFSDVTENAGVGDGLNPSFSGAWIDINNNNLPDLYVINDRWPANSLYKNNGDGTFTNISETSGAAFPLNDPMSNTVGDFNNDGYLDIFMSNSGGNSNLPPLLLVNNGDETFTEQAMESGIEAPDITWGGAWIDFDNDGWKDLFFCTGNLTTNFLYKSQFGMFFTNISSQVLAPPRHSYTCAKGDFNNDGYEDIIVNNLAPEKPIFLENQGGENYYVKIRLTGTVSNRQATGTWVRLYRQGEHFHKYTLCGENFKAQDTRTLTFGLGADHTPVDSAVITYSSGHTDTYYELQPGVTYDFTEGETYQVTVSASQTSAGLCPGDSLLLTSNQIGDHLWSTGETSDSIHVNAGGEYSLTVTNSFGITADDSITVTAFPPPEVVASVEHTPCYGSAEGIALLQNQSETGVESVVWSHGVEGAEIDSLSAGAYVFQLIDANGCIAEGHVTITEPSELEIVLFVEPEVAGLDGSIFISAFGGTPPYQLFLDNVETETAITGLTAGNYEIKVLDSNHCETIYSANVESVMSTTAVNDDICDIYPNPAIDKFFIRSCRELSAVTVIDLSGKEVIRKTRHSKTEYDISQLGAGTYLVKLEQNDGAVTFEKLVKP